MDKKAYWLWLQEALGAGAVTDEITAVFPSPEEMYSRGEIEWRLSGVLTNRQIEKLKQCSPEKAQGIVDVCYNNGWTVLTPDDEDYPPKLRSLRNMPLALFVRGDIKRVTQRVCIAVVGTRKASFQGSYLAHRYAAALAYSGICVVSGAAMGIDSCAHNGALDGGGARLRLRIQISYGKRVSARLRSSERCADNGVPARIPVLGENIPDKKQNNLGTLRRYNSHRGGS